LEFLQKGLSLTALQLDEFNFEVKKIKRDRFHISIRNSLARFLRKENGFPREAELIVK
jgi:hypothetical protein